MNDEFLRRYTYLPYVVDILQQKRLTFLDPGTWDDKNDTYFLQLYKTKMHLNTLLALCFTDSGESYATWKIFAGPPSGVCVEFKKQALLRHLNKQEGVICGPVENPTYNALRKKDGRLFRKLPFMKRWGFRGVKEFRAVYENGQETVSTKFVTIGIESIARIIFNPWMPLPVVESNKIVISSIDGCARLKVDRSSLIDSEKWRAEGDRIARSFVDGEHSGSA